MGRFPVGWVTLTFLGVAKLSKAHRLSGHLTMTDTHTQVTPLDDWATRRNLGVVIETRSVVERWRIEYSTKRSHMSSTNLTLAQYAAASGEASNRRRPRADERGGAEPRVPCSRLPGRHRN